MENLERHELMFLRLVLREYIDNYSAGKSFMMPTKAEIEKIYCKVVDSMKKQT